MFWDSFRSCDYGEHEFTSPKECSISYRHLNDIDPISTMWDSVPFTS